MAGRADGVSLVNIAQTFGGGKTHALGTLYYLCALGAKLPKHHLAVGEILAASKLPTPPAARIDAVSFDKVDWKAGGLVKSPDGEDRQFRMHWNLIAWQLLGKRGIKILQGATKTNQTTTSLRRNCSGWNSLRKLRRRALGHSFFWMSS